MGLLQTGELAAMGTALLWTISALVWTSVGKRVGALATSFIRLPVACIFLMGYGQLFRGRWLPSDATGETLLLLGLSGFAGFFLADICLFKALLLIGPRLTLLLQSLVPPIAALTSLCFLGENLLAKDWAAMVLTLSGVAWVVLENPRGDQPGHNPKHFKQGVVLGILAAAGQAVGMVLARKGIGDYDAVSATFIRVLGAMVGYIVLLSVARRWPTMIVAVRRGRVLAAIIFGAFVGPFLGVVLNMVSLRHCNVGISATIISTTPVIVLPFVILLYRETISLRAAAGAMLSVLGVGLLIV